MAKKQKISRNAGKPRIAVVSGASSGMGREFVLQIGRLYKQLDEIWVIARREELLKELGRESSVPLRIFAGDLAKKKIYKKLEAVLSEQDPDIRMLVSSAGFGKSGSIERIAENEPGTQENMVEVNCRALTRLNLLCLPYMRKGSRIINMASAAGFCPQPYFAVYAATKSYVLSFSRAMRAELKEKGIIVTAVCPGPVDTAFFAVSGNPMGALKKLFMADPKKVVRRALRDSVRGRELSIYGAAMKAFYLGEKLVPVRLITAAESRLFK